jgi:transcriptional antiterminator RfaH
MTSTVPSSTSQPQDLDGTEPWYLAYTKPRQETVAQFNLEQQAFDVYLPLFKKFKTSETGAVAIFEPMFPRYILFRPSRAGQSISVVRSTKGISNIVRFGFEPATLQHELVQRIRQLEQERHQAPLQALSPLKSGQTVRLKHTALGDIQGLVQSVSSKRVAVLLEILGRPTVVQVQHHQLELLT